MGVKVVTAVGLLALLTACSGGTTTGQPAQNPATPTKTSTSESAPAATDECPVGEYEVTTISGKSGTDVNGVPIVAKSGGGLTLTLTDAAWTLNGKGATITLEAANVSVEATVDGTAEGKYAKTGSEYVFQQEKATGKVTLTKPVAGVSTLPMDDVGPALAPGGTAKLTCGEGSLQISSESVVLELKRTGVKAPPTTSTSETSSGGGGGTLAINDSAQTKTIDCAGRNVAMNGSSNELTFTGSCGTVSVNGSRNTITLEKVGRIAVNGSNNKITWSSGDPKVSNNGTGNTISQG